MLKVSPVLQCHTNRPRPPVAQSLRLVRSPDGETALVLFLLCFASPSSPFVATAGSTFACLLLDYALFRCICVLESPVNNEAAFTFLDLTAHFRFVVLMILCFI